MHYKPLVQILVTLFLSFYLCACSIGTKEAADATALTLITLFGENEFENCIEQRRVDCERRPPNYE